GRSPGWCAWRGAGRRGGCTRGATAGRAGGRRCATSWRRGWVKPRDDGDRLAPHGRAAPDGGATRRGRPAPEGGVSRGALLAGLAGACAVLGGWGALVALERARAASAIARGLAPLRRARR